MRFEGFGRGELPEGFTKSYNKSKVDFIKSNNVGISKKVIEDIAKSKRIIDPEHKAYNKKLKHKFIFLLEDWVSMAN